MAEAIKKGDIQQLSMLLYNVMEDVTVPEYPIIRDIKNVMLEGGALNSIMSGSGPTVFGLFESKEKAEDTIRQLKDKKYTEQLYLTKFV